MRVVSTGNHLARRGLSAVKYEVRIVDDNDLPPGHDLVIVERGPAAPPLMLLSGRPARVWCVMRRWEDTLDTDDDVMTMLYAAS